MNFSTRVGKLKASTVC